MTRTKSGRRLERTEFITRVVADVLLHGLRGLDTIAMVDLVRDHKRRAAECPERYYLRFERAEALTPSERRAQDVRVERAAYQFQEMFFVADPDRPGWYVTLHTHPTGITTIWRTSPEACTCPDKEHRRRNLSKECKHMADLRAELGLPKHSIARPVLSEEERAERRARCLRDMERDF